MDRPLTDSRDLLYESAAAEFGAALERLARACEADREKRRDLLQEIHLALWRSMATFREQCSLRTWVYRVAHNVAATWAMRQRRVYGSLQALDDRELESTELDPGQRLDRERAVEWLHRIIRRLNPLDREVMLLYLEGVDATSIAEITGISSSNVATKVHRIKKLLAVQLKEGGSDGKRN